MSRKVSPGPQVPKLSSAYGGVRFKDDVPAHWPKPNAARTKCKICGRAVIKHGNGWVHGGTRIARRPTAGAVKATLAYRDALAGIDAAIEARNDAFRALVDTGMLVHHIAEATGLSNPGVEYLARELGCTIAKADRSVKPSTRLRRRANLKPDGYSLWGDDDILQRPPTRKSG